MTQARAASIAPLTSKGLGSSIVDLQDKGRRKGDIRLGGDVAESQHVHDTGASSIKLAGCTGHIRMIVSDTGIGNNWPAPGVARRSIILTEANRRNFAGPRYGRRAAHRDVAKLRAAHASRLCVTAQVRVRKESPCARLRKRLPNAEVSSRRVVIQQMYERIVSPVARLSRILSDATERVAPIQAHRGAEPRTHAQSPTEEASLVVAERPKVGDFEAR